MKGSNEEIDEAMSKIKGINDFLMQRVEENFNINEVLEQMNNILYGE